MKLKFTGIIGIILLLFTFFSTTLLATDLMTEADSLFVQRSAIFDSEKILADPGNIDRSTALYQKVIDRHPDSVIKEEAVWKILRNYYFKGLFTTLDAGERATIFSTGAQFGEQYVDEFPESTAIHCWFGIVLGYWGETGSKFSSLRNSIPGRVKALSEMVIKMDENYLDGGGYRMYGRLNYKVPKVPFILPWPSKKISIEYLEKACEIAPENLFNQLYLAEVLLDQKQTERAVKILTSIVNTKEIRHGIASDAFIKRQAESLLGSKISD